MTPGEAETAEEELRLSEQALKSAKLLLEASALEDAASRLYYSAFHAARAALAVQGLFAKTHSGLLALYSENFGPAPILRRLLQARSQADYDLKKFALDQGHMDEMVNEAAAFLSSVRRLVNSSIAKGPDEQDPAPDK